MFFRLLFVIVLVVFSCKKELDINDFSDDFDYYKPELRIEALMLPADNTAIIRIDRSTRLDEGLNDEGYYNCIDDDYGRTTEEECNDLVQNIDPEFLFIPGIGIPFTIITPEGFLLDFQTKFLNDDLTLNLTTFIDATYAFHGDGNLKGNLSSIELEYNITDSLKWLFGITNISSRNHTPSDDNYIPSYKFDAMEDFSHFRTQFTYNF